MGRCLLLLPARLHILEYDTHTHWWCHGSRERTNYFLFSHKNRRFRFWTCYFFGLNVQACSKLGSGTWTSTELCQRETTMWPSEDCGCCYNADLTCVTTDSDVIIALGQTVWTWITWRLRWFIKQVLMVDDWTLGYGGPEGSAHCSLRKHMLQIQKTTCKNKWLIQ